MMLRTHLRLAVTVTALLFGTLLATASAGPLPSTLLTRLRQTKRTMSLFRRTSQFAMGRSLPEITTPSGRRFKLMSQNGDDRSASPQRHTEKRDAIPFTNIPLTVDRRPLQTPVKDQGNRSTCVAHACCAMLEVFPEIPDDLSEQDTHWMFMKQLRRRGLGRIVEFPHPTVRDDEGISCTTAGGYLDGHAICAEKYSPYVDDEAELTEDHERRPESAERRAWYGIEDREELSGDDLSNMAKLVLVLNAGHDIVFSVKVAWDGSHVRETGGIVDVVLDDDGNPAEPGGGHAMLMVGYDVKKRHVIVKNSWGDDWGDNGYCYMTLDYLEVYGKHGFWVKKVRVHDDAEPVTSTLATVVRTVGTGIVGAATLGLLGQ